MSEYLDYEGLQRYDELIKKELPTVMGASGTNHKSGLVPDTPTTAGTTKHLREDGTWLNIYVTSVLSSNVANYITEPEIKSVKINGSTTNAASTSNCLIQYDTSNKCLKFIFN